MCVFVKIFFDIVLIKRHSIPLLVLGAVILRASIILRVGSVQLEIYVKVITTYTLVMEALPEECSSNTSKRKAFSVSEESSAHSSVRERSSSGTYLALPNPSPREDF